MKIKAIFFDIDGTLVSMRTHAIPVSTIQKVREIRRQGVKVFIATGRPMPFINNLAGLDYDGIIESNGAHCQLTDGTVLCHRPVPKADIERLVDYIETRDVPTIFATHEELFLTHADTRVHEVFNLLNIDVPPLLPARYAVGLDVMQMVAFFRTDVEQEIMTRVLCGCDAQRWHPEFVDVITSGVQKSSGIDVVAAHYGWDLGELMAFGDGGNDIGMLGHVGYGVAMGNASDAVKASARFITDDIDSDGVAKALDLYLS